MPVFVIAPVLGWGWVMLMPVVMAAAGALGYRSLTSRQVSDWLQRDLERELREKRTIRLRMDEILTDVVSEEIGREERLDFVRDKIHLTFQRDTLGKFNIVVMGPRTMTTLELQIAGDEFARTIIQQFSHHKIARELDQRGVQIVGEEINEDGDIILHTRKWS
ncbi:MAG TPA: hypothetical protein PLB62_04550 [Candidatus Sumerlaeota bacterium]|nr:hypothetical protein [Candidatus Sumerlaeota bacterium]